MKTGPVKTRISVAGIALRDDCAQGASARKIFIARRNPGGDLGNKWEFPGGKARRDETGEEALVREFDEELALPVRVLSRIGEAAFTHGETEFTLRAYRVEFLRPETEALLRVHTVWRWVSPEELEALDFAGSDRLLFPALRRFLAGSAG